MPEEAQLDNGKCLSRTSEPGYFSSMQSRGVIELLGQDLARFMEISGYDTCIWGFEIEEEERAR